MPNDACAADGGATSSLRAEAGFRASARSARHAQQTNGGQSVTTQVAPATLRGLGLPPVLIELASGNEAVARRLLGAPDSVGQFGTDSGGLTDGLLYRGVGEYDMYVLFCTPENKDSWGCTTPMRSRPVYEVSAVRSFPDEASASCFDRDAHARLSTIATLTWVECDMPNYDLEGGATASVSPAGGRFSSITLFRTPPAAAHRRQ